MHHGEYREAISPSLPGPIYDLSIFVDDKKRYRVLLPGIRTAVFIDLIIRITAMIGGEEDGIIFLQCGSDRFLHTLIDGFQRGLITAC